MITEQIKEKKAKITLRITLQAYIDDLYNNVLVKLEKDDLIDQANLLGDIIIDLNSLLEPPPKKSNK